MHSHERGTLVSAPAARAICRNGSDGRCLSCQLFELVRNRANRADQRAWLPYSSIEEKGLLLPVVEADLKFKKPARYDDLVSVNTRVLEMTSVRLHFAYEIRKVNEDKAAESEGNSGELLVTGTTRHVWVNPSWRPVRIEKEAPELWQLLSKYS